LDLARDGHKVVKNYHFDHLEELKFTEMGQKVTIPQQVIIPKKREVSKLPPLEGYVQPTKDACCVTYENDEDQWRAKLACGHTISTYRNYRYHTCVCSIYL